MHRVLNPRQIGRRFGKRQQSPRRQRGVKCAKRDNSASGASLFKRDLSTVFGPGWFGTGKLYLSGFSLQKPEEAFPR